MKTDYSTQDSGLLMPLIVPAESRNKLLAKANLSIPTEERLILGLSLNKTRFAAGESIFGGEIDHILFIEQGIACETMLTSEGDPLGVSIIGCEGAVGLRGMSSGAYSFHVRALTALEALQISARGLALACSRSRELEKLLRNYSDLLLQDSIVRLACHYNHNIDKRLPRGLLTAASRLRSNRLPFTQEVLAETHGVTPGAISVVLDALESNRLVERARKEIIVLDRRRLLRRACGCYSAIDQAKKYMVNSGNFWASL
jgi:CRP-like cAMP-binding protein